MEDYASYVNVFQGCDEIDLPKPVGVATAWRFIKGLAGNNTPGAAWPFGKMTACCFSAGYSSGYGRLKVNSGGYIHHLYDRDKFKGIAHLQGDGTGYISAYYNYAVLSPFTGALADADAPRDFSNEGACPGYYALTDSLTGADCEVTVTPRAALHRITCPAPGTRLSINFANDGLYSEELSRPAGEATMTLLSDAEAAIAVVLHGLPLWFHVRFEGLASPLRLWVDHREIEEKTVSIETGHRFFGVVAEAGAQVHVALGISPKSAEIARADATGCAMSFDEAKAAARVAWNEALSRVQAEFEDEKDREIFYSNLYHTLIKPADWSGESPLYAEPEFMLDFATIWDQYKTALPFIYTVYPDAARKAVKTLLNTARATGVMPHTFMLIGDCLNEEHCGQARMLAEHSIVDAYLRGVPFDYDEALSLMYADAFTRSYYDAFLKNEGGAGNNAFVIDITDACAACALMARERGQNVMAERFEKVAARWREVFTSGDGLLNDESYFYEGTRWNYSFRLMHDMPGRMELAGGEEGFAKLADRFFGFVEPDNRESSCFEGFNNETDMEAPYVYHFCGRHDRLCEVIASGIASMFTTGRGGVPGNNDSGGLSSLYLWNALGVFPASGQDLMIIGTPRVKAASLALSNGRTLHVEREGAGVYVREALWNGRPLDRLALTVREMMAGGELRLHMTEHAGEAQLV
ncbi:MAG: glycoside hydrolase family 92 protein [Clostridia bacterium]|nr:glycoside hydrolase family 92 protein [Clostridia bacterium]